jgi:hypothetical protein
MGPPDATVHSTLRSDENTYRLSWEGPVMKHLQSFPTPKQRIRKRRYRLFMLSEASNLFHRISAGEMVAVLFLVLTLIYFF